MEVLPLGKSSLVCVVSPYTNYSQRQQFYPPQLSQIPDGSETKILCTLHIFGAFLLILETNGRFQHMRIKYISQRISKTWACFLLLRQGGFTLNQNSVSLLGKNQHCCNGVFTALGNSNANIYLKYLHIPIVDSIIFLTSHKLLIFKPICYVKYHSKVKFMWWNLVASDHWGKWDHFHASV